MSATVVKSRQVAWLSSVACVIVVPCVTKETPKSYSSQVGTRATIPETVVHAQRLLPHQSRNVGSFTMSPLQSAPSMQNAVTAMATNGRRTEEKGFRMFIVGGA